MPKFYWDILYLNNKSKYEAVNSLQEAVLFYLNELIFWDKSKASNKHVKWLQDMVLHYMQLLSKITENALTYMTKPKLSPNRIIKRYRLIRH
ncbi:hypothetical protein FQR65_LT00640 [Abscondita terminalis]|nr:hypothetical protein FQR65_LT00640 [Abscondita terminalis]